VSAAHCARYLNGSAARHQLEAAAGRALAAEASLATSESSAARLRAELDAATSARDAERAARDELEAQLRALGTIDHASRSRVALSNKSASESASHGASLTAGAATGEATVAPAAARSAITLPTASPSSAGHNFVRRDISVGFTAAVDGGVSVECDQDAARAVVERIAAARLPHDGEGKLRQRLFLRVVSHLFRLSCAHMRGSLLLQTSTTPRECSHCSLHHYHRCRLPLPLILAVAQSVSLPASLLKVHDPPSRISRCKHHPRATVLTSLAACIIAPSHASLSRVAGRDGALQATLGRALEALSSDMYDDATHFFHEIVQNCDDCSYKIGSLDKGSAHGAGFGAHGAARGPVADDEQPRDEGGGVPSLRVVVRSDAISMTWNERGMSASDVEALCDLGRSTKGGRDAIGRKGVGFKSVFAVSDNPQVLSNGFSFAFDIAKHGAFGALVPQWQPRSVMLSHLPPEWRDDLEDPNVGGECVGCNPLLLRGACGGVVRAELN
jgi:hypothetical protein